MLDLTRSPNGFLDPITRVVEPALDHAAGLKPENVMVVGAWCRDIMHTALGHSFATAATRDLDLALALSSWDAYRSIAAAFPRVGDTGIRFRIANVPRASAHLLGLDIASTIGPERTGEMLRRWPGDINLLVREFQLRGGPNWPGTVVRRRGLIDVLTRGLRGER